MVKALTFMLALLMLSTNQACQAKVVVLVNPKNPIDKLSRAQVVDIYMGRFNNFPDGQPVSPLDQSPDSADRASFYQVRVGKTIAQVNAYWARLLFTGRVTPHRVLSDSVAVLNTVHLNKDSLAYVDSQVLDGKVKVVYRLKQGRAFQ